MILLQTMNNPPSGRPKPVWDNPPVILQQSDSTGGWAGQLAKQREDISALQWMTP
jgi:hypothetical protein